MYFFVKGGINILWFLTKKTAGGNTLTKKVFVILSKL